MLILFPFFPLQDGAEQQTPRGDWHVRPGAQEGYVRHVGATAQGHPARHRPRKVLGWCRGATDRHCLAVSFDGAYGAQRRELTYVGGLG